LVLACAGCVDRGDVLGPELASNAPAALATDVSAGQFHTLAVSRGALYAWGNNEHGELGLGDNDDRLLPEVVPTALRFVAVAAANQHSCAIDDLSDVYCWGENARGQLGQGDRNPSPTPLSVDLPAPAASLSARFNHTCALLKNAALHCWGRNDEGQLGQGDPGVGSDTTAADGLAPLPVGGAEWIDVGSGDGHTCAVRLDGALFCWGRNTSRELGADDRIQVREPIRVGSDLDWLDVDAGQHHTLAIKRDGTLHAWGENVAIETDEGFPLGIDAPQVDTPEPVPVIEDAARVSTQVFHTCAIARGGDLYCWGRNTEGQLGLGDIALRRESTLVTRGVLLVSTSWFTTCVITAAGGVACTGKNEQGELGLGHLDRPLVLTDVVLPAP
jgi:alpha-tubulin suppressor-like RCC1 family protein